MPKVTLYDRQGEKAGEFELPDEIFAAPVNEALLHQAVVAYLANQRQGTSATKSRGMVSGGGRKPWRQKGTGRARHGSIRSPIWKGGGVVFGPQPRDYRKKLPKKARREALRSALSAKAGAGEVRVLEELAFEAPKTRQMAELLGKIDAEKALLVTADLDRNVYLSARNIPGVKTTLAQDLNVYDLLSHQNVVLTKDAVARVEEVLGR